jgi:hypothetical protein
MAWRHAGHFMKTLTLRWLTEKNFSGKHAAGNLFSLDTKLLQEIGKCRKDHARLWGSRIIRFDVNILVDVLRRTE